MITQKRLKECLHYEPLTGIFTWLERPRSHFPTDRGWRVFNARDAGKPAGSKQKRKRERTRYLVIRIDDKIYQAHRLAWLYVHGKFPDNQIDHIDGDGLNNKLDNLRDVTNRENQMNTKTRRDNTSGIKGVYWEEDRKKWSAKIGINGKVKNLGRYTTIEEAAAVRKEAELTHGYTTPGTENALTTPICKVTKYDS